MGRVSLHGLALLLWAGLWPATMNITLAQEAAPGKDAKEAAEKQARPMQAYRVEFNMRELEDGKRVNARSYAVLVGLGFVGQMRVGSRVPVSVREKETTYHDVGMKIDCTLREQENALLLVGSLESSSVVPSGQTDSMNRIPVFRDIKSNFNAPITFGTPTVVSVMDDVATNRRYEIEVTVSKLK